MRSLRSQLTLGVLVVLTAVLGGAGLYVLADVERSERAVIDDRLERTAELTRVTAVNIVAEGLPTDGSNRQLDDVLRASGSSLRLIVGGQPVVEAGVPLPKGLKPPLGFSTRTLNGRPTRIYVTTLKDESLAGVARQEVTSSLRQLERRQDALRARMLTLGAVMLAVAGLGVLVATSRVLRPLRRLRRATAAVAVAGDDDLVQQRVPVQGPQELRALAGSFNDMLVRLGRAAQERTTALEATRRFAADAGHELRTPLTSVQASLSILARHPDLGADQRTQLADDALAEQRRLVHLLDGLQALARGDANPVPHTAVDLLDVVDASLQAARARHPRITWESHLPDAEDDAGPAVRGWEAGLRVLVDNLLLNAARHGRPDGTVRVTVDDDPAGGEVTLTVEDDGPGIPPQERERIFAPFAHATDTDRPGSGLGLALVAQQAGHHEARVTVDASPQLGGARFAVRYPRARRSLAARSAKTSGA